MKNAQKNKQGKKALKRARIQHKQINEREAYRERLSVFFDVHIIRKGRNIKFRW
jgi:hypothetical protein